MKICPLVVWDSFGLSNQYSGIGQHGLNLYRHLGDLGTQPLLLSFPGQALPNAFNHIKLEFPKWKFLRRSKLGRVQCISRDLKWCSDLVQDSHGTFVFHGLSNFNVSHSTLSDFCSTSRIRRILTIHDLIPLIRPDGVSRSLALQMSLLLPRAIKAADTVITVSEWTRQSILEFWPNFAAKIITIPNGFDVLDKSTLAPNVSRDTYENKRLRLLVVSRWEPYKRFDRLVDILKLSYDQIEITLITDSKGSKWCSENADRFLKRSQLIVKTQVSPSTLNELYQSHDCYFHPSDYEGFCLPAAEAIVRQKPVIFQKGSGIDEVVGPCGLGLSRTSSISFWVDSILSQDWGKKTELIPDWLGRQLSWSEVALKTQEVYNVVSH